MSLSPCSHPTIIGGQTVLWTSGRDINETSLGHFFFDHSTLSASDQKAVVLRSECLSVPQAPRASASEGGAKEVEFSAGPEAISPEPEWSDGMQVLLVGARNIELLSSLDAQNIFTGGQRLDLFNKRRVDYHATMNADESVRQEFLRDSGQGFAKKV
jgi:hypothetical protein